MSNPPIVFTCMPMFVSIDSHSEEPFFPVEFVDRDFMKLGVGDLAGAGAFQDALQ